MSGIRKRDRTKINSGSASPKCVVRSWCCHSLQLQRTCAFRTGLGETHKTLEPNQALRHDRSDQNATFGRMEYFRNLWKRKHWTPSTQGEKVGTERAMPRLYFGTPNASIVLRNTKSLDCTSRELLGHNTLTFTQVKSQFPLQAHNFSDGTLPDPTPNVPVCPSQAHTIEWQRNFA